MMDEFNAFLEDISHCFIARDVELWRSRLTLPFSIITREGPVVLRNEEALRVNFEHYLSASDLMGLTLVDRRPVSLEDCGDGTWLGTFETRLLADQTLATAPYTATALLTLRAGRFRMSSMLNGRGHSQWTGVTDA